MKREWMAGIVEQRSETSPRELLRRVSGADEASMRKMDALFKGCPELPQDGFEAAKRARAYLIESGFKYHSDAFRVQDVMHRKGGNCLGLTVLIGTLLQERGYRPSYEVILNPHDAIYEQDQALLVDLVNGDYFSYDETPLPDKLAEHRDYRFTPLEHPDMIFNGRRFETTSLDPEEGPTSDWAPKEAERIVTIDYAQLVSNLHIDFARNSQEVADPLVVKGQFLQGLELWPENREGWASVKGFAERMFDDELWSRAIQSYVRIGGEDSRYHFTLYEWTEKMEHLDAALKSYPAHIGAFVEKYVMHAKSARDACFNFSVAAYCIANSSEQDIHLFYLNHIDQMCEWHGKRFVANLLKRVKAKKYQPVATAMTERRVFDNSTSLKKLIDGGWWPSMPRDQLEVATVAQGLSPKCTEELAKLTENYGHSRLFQRSISSLQARGIMK